MEVRLAALAPKGRGNSKGHSAGRSPGRLVGRHSMPPREKTGHPGRVPRGPQNCPVNPSPSLPPSQPALQALKHVAPWPGVLLLHPHHASGHMSPAALPVLRLLGEGAPVLGPEESGEGGRGWGGGGIPWEQSFSAGVISPVPPPQAKGLSVGVMSVLHSAPPPRSLLLYRPAGRPAQAQVNRANAEALQQISPT